MIHEYSVVKMADNAGARTGRCIRVLGGSRKRYAGIGDLIVVALHGVAPNGALEEGQVAKAVVVRTKKEYRRDPTKGTDPWEKRAPTICRGGIWLVFPSGREVRVPVKILRWIRTRGGDVDFKFSPGDGVTLQRLILAMGVSTVVGSAARRALDRWIEEYGLSPK